jgi:hypothetical protein
MFHHRISSPTIGGMLRGLLTLHVVLGRMLAALVGGFMAAVVGAGTGAVLSVLVDTFVLTGEYWGRYPGKELGGALRAAALAGVAGGLVGVLAGVARGCVFPGRVAVSAAGLAVLMAGIFLAGLAGYVTPRAGVIVFWAAVLGGSIYSSGAI